MHHGTQAFPIHLVRVSMIMWAAFMFFEVYELLAQTHTQTDKLSTAHGQRLITAYETIMMLMAT